MTMKPVPTLYVQGLVRRDMSAEEPEDQHEGPNQPDPVVEREENPGEEVGSGVEHGHDLLYGAPSPFTVEIPQTQRVKRQYFPVLQAMGQKDLSPQCKNLYQELIKVKRNLYRCKNSSLVSRVAKKAVVKSPFYRELSSINPVAAKFLVSQICLSKFKPKGRRYTLDEKILALAIYKHGTKSYKLLSSIFSLPSRKSLSRLLNQIPFETGVNQAIFKHLESVVKTLKSPRDRYCTIMFDEFKLESGISHDLCSDELCGFVDLGMGCRRPEIATHAILFMLRGIARNWKQPVAYAFTSSIKAFDLQCLLRKIVIAVEATGLRIISTVCDQASANSSAIKSLVEQTRAMYIRNGRELKSFSFEIIPGKPIFPIYDPPHLLKSIRNNLLTKNLVFKSDDQQKEASWSHVIRLYQTDIGVGGTRPFSSLTDNHINPEGKHKMKVSLAAQVLSNKIGAFMKLLSTSNLLDTEAAQTAEILLFFDQLFDSFNSGVRYDTSPGKVLRSALTYNSPHHSFWTDAKRLLRTMKFKNNDGALFSVPSLKNWLVNIDNIRKIWRYLKNEGFTFLTIRSFNLDPVENLFGSIRAINYRNNNPTCGAFPSALKSLVISNFLSSSSFGKNCEIDESSGALSTLKIFVQQAIPRQESRQTNSKLANHFKTVDSIVNNSKNKKSSFIGTLSLNYISEYVFRKLINNIENCPTCNSNIASQSSTSDHAFISIRKAFRNLRWLKYCNPRFVQSVKFVCQYLFKILPFIVHVESIRAFLIEKLSTFDIFSWNTCPEHREINVKIFLKSIINVVLYNFITMSNRILKGRETRPSLISSNSFFLLCNQHFIKSRVKVPRVPIPSLVSSPVASPVSSSVPSTSRVL